MGVEGAAIAVLWIEFVREIRLFWDQGATLPRMSTDLPPDLATCLLHQKLQLVHTITLSLPQIVLKFVGTWLLWKTMPKISKYWKLLWCVDRNSKFQFNEVTCSILQARVSERLGSFRMSFCNMTRCWTVLCSWNLILLSIVMISSVYFCMHDERLCSNRGFC